ncbi:MAG: enoyl-CoA hydratase/isomerase family protein [Planctomycetaceae bacterium]
MFVELTKTNGVARLLLNRPDKRNALTDDFIREITAAVEDVAADESVRVLVVAAAGTVFCAGMDLGQMQQRAQADNSEELWLQDSQILRDTFKAMFQLPIPTVAVVQGAAVAGGMGLITSCDMVLASTNAFFALPEPQRGITAAMVTPLLLHRIATSAANELLLGGGRMSAKRAAQVGLCLEPVDPDELEAAEAKLVCSILNGSRAALAQTKQHVINCAGPNVMQQLDESVELSALARRTSDAREGLQAFLEKRKANWIPQDG